MQDSRLGRSPTQRAFRQGAFAGLAAAAVVLSGFCSPAAAVSVQNGSFSTVQTGHSSSYVLTPGNNTSVPSWNYQPNLGGAFGCMVINDTFNTACTNKIGPVTGGENPGFSPNGGNFIAIATDASNNASITQTLAGLVAGTKYNISFYQSAINDESGPASIEWVVTLGTTQLNPSPVVMSPNADSSSPWSLQTLSFTATSAEVGNPMLKFLAQSTLAGGPPIALLDGVQVPEPASIALLGVGIAGLAGLRRRRARLAA